tara:strand:+ start:310 stop:507 length:198 start_codon:yes stop_codon:yes gene_type:complete
VTIAATVQSIRILVWKGAETGGHEFCADGLERLCKTPKLKAHSAQQRQELLIGSMRVNLKQMLEI